MNYQIRLNNISAKHLHLLLALIAALSLLAAACSSGDPVAIDIETNEGTSDEDTDGSASSDSSDDDSEDDADDDGDADDSDSDDSDSDDSDSDDSDSSDNTDTDDIDSDDDIPGEAWDGFAAAGDLFGVVGVAHDDVLNVRAQPNADADIIETLDPTATGIEATGEGWILPSSIWYEVTTDAGPGWVSAQFVAFVGGTDDATAEYESFGAATEAETMVQLADQVADAFILEDDVGTRVVQTVAPTVGDLGEITYDIIGLGDDAVGGYRLYIFAAPIESGEGFSLKSIERTYLCSRGTDGELCF